MARVRGRRAGLALAVLLGLGAAPAHAAPGDVDTGFAGGSFSPVYTTTFPGAEDAHGVAVDLQGRVLLSATEEAAVNGGTPRTIKVTRLSAQGVVDTGFGAGGTATLPTTGDVRHAGIVVDAQDRPLILGYADAGTAFPKIVLTRLTTVGTPDPGFGGGDGVAITDTLAVGARPRPEGIGLTPSGQILVAGTVITAVQSGFIARFDPTSGELDPAYGTGGWTGLGDSGTQITALHVLPGGAAFAGGWDSYAEWVVAKVTAGGALDNAFDGDGLARSTLGGATNITAYGMTADAQERPVIVGQHTTSIAQLAVMRWTAVGAPDASFGSGTPTAGALFMPGVAGARGLDAAIDCTGRLLVAAGASRPPPVNQNRAVLARLLENGSLDPSFAPGATTSGIASFVSGEYNVPTDLLLTDAGAYLAGFQRIRNPDMSVNDQPVLTRLLAGDGCGGSEPPPPSPPAPGTPPAAPPAQPPATAALPVFSKLVKLPPTRRCVSRRNFSIRLKVPAGSSVVEATVNVNGKRAAVRRGARLRSTVDLRSLPKGRFKVEVVLKLADGRRVKDNRRYKTCAPKKRR